jgi:O-antigen/teichoic acid export membrane protein
MGIIQKQSSKSVFILAASFIIGAINLLFLYKQFFTKDEVGLTRVLLDITILLSSFAALGSNGILIKFFPFYRDYTKPKQNDLFFFTALMGLIGFLLIIVFVHCNQHLIVKKYIAKAPLLVNYFYLVYSYCFFYLLFGWLEAIAWCYKITTTSNFLRELVVRLSTSLFIVLYIFKVISFKVFLTLVSLSFALPSIILFYSIQKKQPIHFFAKFSKVTIRFKKRLISFATFTLLGLGLNVLARVFDTIFISSNNGLADAFLFTIAAYFATLLEIPQRSIANISVPVLADSWKEKNLNNIQDIYTKSSATLLLIGIAMFGLLWINVNNIIGFLGVDYIAVKYVIFYLGITKVLDMSTGVNGQIITTSNLWKFDFYTSVMITVVAIVTNYFLIKGYGIEGAAIGNFITFFFYNAVRCYFLYKKFKLQPFTINSFYIVALGVGSIAITYLLPAFKNIYFDSICRSTLFLAIFIPLLYKINPVPDLKEMILSKMNHFIK